MKSIYVLALSLLLWSSISVAQTPTKDALLNRVVSIYLDKLYPPDSPMFEMFIDAAKSINPGVSSDIWLGIKQELATTVSMAAKEELGPILRKSLENFSDVELEKLGQIISDPVFYKFQAAMLNSSTQKQIMQAAPGIEQKFKAAANGSLVNYSLKEVYFSPLKPY